MFYLQSIDFAPAVEALAVFRGQRRTSVTLVGCVHFQSDEGFAHQTLLVEVYCGYRVRQGWDINRYNNLLEIFCTRLFFLVFMICFHLRQNFNRTLKLSPLSKRRFWVIVDMDFGETVCFWNLDASPIVHMWC